MRRGLKRAEESKVSVMEMLSAEAKTGRNNKILTTSFKMNSEGFLNDKEVQPTNYNYAYYRICSILTRGKK